MENNDLNARADQARLDAEHMLGSQALAIAEARELVAVLASSLDGGQTLEFRLAQLASDALTMLAALSNLPGFVPMTDLQVRNRLYELGESLTPIR